MHCGGKSDSPGPELDPDEPSWYSLIRPLPDPQVILRNRPVYHVPRICPRVWAFLTPRIVLVGWVFHVFSTGCERRRDLAALVKWILILSNLLQPVFDDKIGYVPRRPRRVYERARVRALHRVDNLADSLPTQPPRLKRYSVRGSSFLFETRSLPIPNTGGVSRLPIKTVDIL